MESIIIKVTTTDGLDQAIDLGKRACFGKDEKATAPKDNPYCLKPLYIDPGWSLSVGNGPGLDRGTTTAPPTPGLVGNNEFTASKDTDESMIESNQAPTFETSQTFSLHNNGGATTPSSLLNPVDINNPNLGLAPVTIGGGGANMFPTPQAVEMADNDIFELGRRRVSRRRRLRPRQAVT